MFRSREQAAQNTHEAVPAKRETVLNRNTANSDYLLDYFALPSDNEVELLSEQELADLQAAIEASDEFSAVRVPSKTFGERASDVVTYIRENPPKLSPKIGVASVGVVAAVGSIFAPNIGAATAVENPEAPVTPNNNATYLPDSVEEVKIEAPAEVVNITVDAQASINVAESVASTTEQVASEVNEALVTVTLPEDNAESVESSTTNVPVAPVTEAEAVDTSASIKEIASDTATPIESTPIVPQAPVSAPEIGTAQVDVSAAHIEPSAAQIESIALSTPKVEVVANPNAFTAVELRAAISKSDRTIEEKAQSISAGLTFQKPTIQYLPELGRNASPEEKEAYAKLEAIIGAITANDITRATLLIKDGFHDSSIPLTKKNKHGELYVPATNAGLVASLEQLQNAYPGHADANYNFNARLAFAVTNAIAADQSIFNSKEIQALIASIQPPQDPHQAKRFEAYAANAKSLLESNAEDGTQLINGFNETVASRLNTLVAYLLSANVTDEQQAAEIQAIIDEEARIAAEEAARNAANGNYASSPEAQAMQNLYDREGDPAIKRAFYIMQQIMAQTGLSAVRVAGIMGNLSVESASTFDPSVDQSNYGGGNAKGIAQWEASRFRDLQNFAAARGTEWNDMDTQIAFLISELPHQGDTINRLNSVDNIFDSAAIFLRGFERPADQSDSAAQRRADRGQRFLDAFNAEYGTVVAARAAAEEERKKGLAESFDEANMWADSTGLEIPGFVKAGNDTAFHDGNPYAVGLYEIPGTVLKSEGTPALVNARAIYQANAMFAQMRKDLGLDVIYFNDSYRTMEGQEEADRKDKDSNGRDMGGAAAPGHSAHQSGYAFDIDMGTLNGAPYNPGYTAGVNTEYWDSPVWRWLHDNAHKYHFKQWGPEGWHWSINGK